MDSSTDFETTFRQLYAPMVLYAYRLCQDKAEAEDVVQDVFCKYLQSGGKHLNKNREAETIKNAKGYLFTLLHNAVIDRLRRGQRYQTVDIKDEYSEETTEKALFEIELYEQLYKEIESLPAKNAEVMRLKLQGKSDREIAEMQGIKYETVRSHIKYGISILRKKFDKDLLLLLFC